MPDKIIADSIPIAWIEEKIGILESNCESDMVSTLRGLISWWIAERDDYLI